MLSGNVTQPRPRGTPPIMDEPGPCPGPGRDNVVTIVSNENGVSMVATTRAVVEGAGAVEIFANRSGGTGAVDVNFTFGGGTAVNNTHYQGVNGSLHWNDGETGQKSVLVNILDDSLVNTARTFPGLVATLAGVAAVGLFFAGRALMRSTRTPAYAPHAVRARIASAIPARPVRTLKKRLLTGTLARRIA